MLCAFSDLRIRWIQLAYIPLSKILILNEEFTWIFVWSTKVLYNPSSLIRSHKRRRRRRRWSYRSDFCSAQSLHSMKMSKNFSSKDNLLCILHFRQRTLFVVMLGIWNICSLIVSTKVHLENCHESPRKFNHYVN